MSAEVIWKHPLTRVSLALPEGAQVIHVGLDGDGMACLWERHPVDAPDGPPRRFTAVFTGEHFSGGAHLGTWLVGGLVYHLFETTGGVPS